MFSFLGRLQLSPRLTLKQLPNLEALAEDERIEFKYDLNGNLIAVQKIKLSWFSEPIRARAATDIEPGSTGQVFAQGTYWKALCDGHYRITKGQKLIAVARHNLTLFVLPIL